MLGKLTVGFKGLMFLSPKWYGRTVRSDLTVPMGAKHTAFFDKIFNSSLSWSWMRYGRMVRSAAAVPMVTKFTGNYEHQKFMCNSRAFMHHHCLENG
jgi:hypothetical protein